MTLKIRSILVATTALALLAAGGVADAQKKKKDKAPQVSVGRTPMTTPVEDLPPPPPPPTPVQTIAQALPTLANHATLVRLIQASPIAASLAAPAPITVFAPSDDAFTRLAPGTVDTLLKPENAATLALVLRNHVVAGAVSYDQLKAMIAQGGGRASLPTLAGQPLIATIDSGLVLLTDPNGGKSYISQADLKEANGVIHITNGVSVPKLG